MMGRRIDPHCGAPGGALRHSRADCASWRPVESGTLVREKVDLEEVVKESIELASCRTIDTLPEAWRRTGRAALVKLIAMLPKRPQLDGLLHDLLEVHLLAHERADSTVASWRSRPRGVAGAPPGLRNVDRCAGPIMCLQRGKGSLDRLQWVLSSWSQVAHEAAVGASCERARCSQAVARVRARRRRDLRPPEQMLTSPSAATTTLKLRRPRQHRPRPGLHAQDQQRLATTGPARPQGGGAETRADEDERGAAHPTPSTPGGTDSQRRSVFRERWSARVVSNSRRARVPCVDPPARRPRPRRPTRRSTARRGARTRRGGAFQYSNKAVPAAERHLLRRVAPGERGDPDQGTGRPGGPPPGNAHPPRAPQYSPYARTSSLDRTACSGNRLRPRPDHCPLGGQTHLGQHDGRRPIAGLPEATAYLPAVQAGHADVRMTRSGCNSRTIWSASRRHAQPALEPLRSSSGASVDVTASSSSASTSLPDMARRHSHY